MESVKHITLAESQTPGAVIIERTLLFRLWSESEQRAVQTQQVVFRKNKKSNSQRMDKKTIKGKKKTSQGEQEEEFVLPVTPPPHPPPPGPAGEGPEWRGEGLGFVGFDV